MARTAAVRSFLDPWLPRCFFFTGGAGGAAADAGPGPSAWLSAARGAPVALSTPSPPLLPLLLLLLLIMTRPPETSSTVIWRVRSRSWFESEWPCEVVVRSAMFASELGQAHTGTRARLAHARK